MGFGNRYMITCCNECPNRFPGCHGSCEKYKKARAEYDAKRAEARKKYDIACGLAQQQSDGIHRVTKHRNYRSKYRKGH